MPTKTLSFPNARHLNQLYCGRAENLALVERQLGVTLATRDEWLKIDGPDTAIALAESFFNFLNDGRTQGLALRQPDFAKFLDAFARGEEAKLRALFAEPLVIATNRRSIVPKTIGQTRVLPQALSALYDRLHAVATELATGTTPASS